MKPMPIRLTALLMAGMISMPGVTTASAGEFVGIGFSNGDPQIISAGPAGSSPTDPHPASEHMNIIAAAMEQPQNLEALPGRTDWNVSSKALETVEKAADKVFVPPMRIVFIDTPDNIEKTMEQFKEKVGDFPMEIKFNSAADSTGQLTAKGIEAALKKVITDYYAKENQLFPQLVHLPTLDAAMQKAVEKTLLDFMTNSAFGGGLGMTQLPIVVMGIGDPNAPKHEIAPSLKSSLNEYMNVNDMPLHLSQVAIRLKIGAAGAPKNVYEILSAATNILSDGLGERSGYLSKVVVGIVGTADQKDMLLEQFRRTMANDPMGQKIEVRFYDATDASGKVTAKKISEIMDKAIGDKAFTLNFAIDPSRIDSSVPRGVMALGWNGDQFTLLAGADSPLSTLPGVIAVDVAAAGGKVGKGAERGLRPEDLIVQKDAFAAVALSGLFTQLALRQLNAHLGDAFIWKVLTGEKLVLSPTSGVWKAGVNVGAPSTGPTAPLHIFRQVEVSSTIRVAFIGTPEQAEEAVKRFKETAGNMPVKFLFYNVADASGAISADSVIKAMEHATSSDNDDYAQIIHLSFGSLPATVAGEIAEALQWLAYSAAVIAEQSNPFTTMDGVYQNAMDAILKIAEGERYVLRPTAPVNPQDDSTPLIDVMEEIRKQEAAQRAKLIADIEAEYRKALKSPQAVIPAAQVEDHIAQLKKGVSWTQIQKSIAREVAARVAQARKIYADIGIRPTTVQLTAGAMALQAAETAVVRAQLIEQHRTQLEAALQAAATTHFNGHKVPLTEAEMDALVESLKEKPITVVKKELAKALAARTKALLAAYKAANTPAPRGVKLVTEVIGAYGK